MKLLDVQHPFFRPLWRRVAVTAVCLIWAAFEYLTGNPGWATLFGVTGLVCAHQFLLTYTPKDPD